MSSRDERLRCGQWYGGGSLRNGDLCLNHRVNFVDFIGPLLLVCGVCSFRLLKYHGLDKALITWERQGVQGRNMYTKGTGGKI